ncbi:hypothetical protein N9018_02735 [Rhodopirellula sp.]|nr:hypothetical protein [bacterium]MDB4477100.1 hypothetical protein [Rhodopirellula sp.]MDB4532670.1 hypothetical protein [bacterium]
MMPPNCCLCDKGIESGDTCELISFAKTESDREWHVQATLGEGFTGHPPDCDWFCDIHAHAAKHLVHYDRSAALLYLQQNEWWHLIYIDLFDRDTPPSVQKSGVGFESGFVEFWDKILSTTEPDGRRYPSDYRLSFSSADLNYSLPRDCTELTTIKQHTLNLDDAMNSITELAKGQAEQMRTNGLSGAAKHLTQQCVQLSPNQK